MFFKSHFFAMVVYAIVCSVVFALLMRSRMKDRGRFAVIVALSMILGAIAVGWLLYPFP